MSKILLNVEIVGDVHLVQSEVELEFLGELVDLCAQVLGVRLRAHELRFEALILLVRCILLHSHLHESSMASSQFATHVQETRVIVAGFVWGGCGAKLAVTFTRSLSLEMKNMSGLT